MSRASKGFADFFPTAPSVLQQKRSRAAQHRRRQESSSVVHADPTPAVSDAVEVATKDGELDKKPLINGTDDDERMADQIPVVQDEGDYVQGDLLNGVGSASSSSTTSSVFSTHHRNLSVTHNGGAYHMATLTPITNTDSSPPGVHKSPSQHKLDRFVGMDVGNSSRTPDSHHVAPTPEALTPISSPGRANTQARPGRGEVKGVKVVYDPELDKKLSSKEKKARKVQYKTFGEEVWFQRILTRHAIKSSSAY